MTYKFHTEFHWAQFGRVCKKTKQTKEKKAKQTASALYVVRRKENHLVSSSGFSKRSTVYIKEGQARHGTWEETAMGAHCCWDTDGREISFAIKVLGNSKLEENKVLEEKE